MRKSGSGSGIAGEVRKCEMRGGGNGRESRSRRSGSRAGVGVGLVEKQDSSSAAGRCRNRIGPGSDLGKTV